MSHFTQPVQSLEEIKNTIGNLIPVIHRGVFIVQDDIQNETQLDSGIILLDTTVRKLQYRPATVISVGRGVKSVKAGDRVITGSFYGKEIDFGHKFSSTVKLISDDQIDAVISGVECLA